MKNKLLSCLLFLMALFFISEETFNKKIDLNNGQIGVSKSDFIKPIACFAPNTDALVIQSYYDNSKDNGLDTSEFNLISRWTETALSGSGLSQGDFTTLTWSYVADGTPISNGGCQFPGESDDNSDFISFFNGIYGPPSDSNDLTTAPWHSIFVDMFNSWSAVAGIEFIYEPNDDGVPVASEVAGITGEGVDGVRGDIRISGHAIDGDSGFLACNYYPQVGDMIIDTSDIYYSNNSGLGTSNILTHEIGHGIGILHVCPINETKLMEPFISLAFQGPQEDDILAANRMYGDYGGDTSSISESTFLGSENNPTSYNALQRSIDDNSDVDYYSFTVNESSTALIRLTPTGSTYLEDFQDPVTFQCNPGSNFNAAEISDLMFEFIDTDSSTVLDTANNSGLGDSEFTAVEILSSGTYFVRVSQQGNENNVQMYNLEIILDAGTCNAASIPANLQASLITSSTAQVVWNAQSNMLYDLRYRESGSTTWIIIPNLIQPSASFSGLLGLTEYEVQVSAKCSGETPTAYSNSLFFTTLTGAPVYCDSGSENNFDSEILNVFLVGENDTIYNFTYDECTIGLNDYTDQSADLLKGSVYTLEVEFGDCDGEFVWDSAAGVWIDWNNDGDFFDLGEEIGIVDIFLDPDDPSYVQYEIFDIFVPSDLSISSTRMRIVQDEFALFDSDLSPCGIFEYGSTEDYTLTFINPPCNTPANLEASNITTTTAFLNWDVLAGAISGYDYYLVNDGTLPPDNTTTPTGSVGNGVSGILINNLNSDSDYDAYIRSNCGGNNFSDWSLATSFSTLATCPGTTYTGNGNTGFGGPVGQSSLVLEDDGTTITGTFTKGAGDFNDAMVIYLSTGLQGRNVIDTNVNDQEDPLRRAISQAGTDDSIVTFPTGFEATHAIAINVGFGGLWSIPSTGSVGNNGLDFITGIGAPASITDASFTFSFDWADIGLTDINEFDFVITYLNSNNGFSSDEGYGNGIPTPNPGTNDFTFTSSESFPEYFYIFDGTTWIPSDPDGVNELCRRAVILSGSDTFTNETVLEAIKINPQGVLNIDANLFSDLIFKSDASSSGQLDDATGNIVSGTAIVERYIPAKRAFRFLASPVTTTDFIFENWQENGSTPLLPDGRGTHITGGTSGGFDQSGSNNPSMFTFDNSNGNGTPVQTDDWIPLSNTNATKLRQGEAYLTMVRGDRSIDVTSNSAPPTVTTLSSVGALQTGALTYSVGNSTSYLNLNDVDDFYNLIANPYQAVVDFNAVTKTGLTDFIYVWDASIDGASGRGGYVAVGLPTGSPTEGDPPSPSSSDADQYIAPGMSFFVQNDSDGATTTSITFEEADKATTENQVTVFSAYTNFYINSRLYKSSNLQNGDTESDAIGLRFSDDFTTFGNSEDATKLFNPGENYAIVNNGLRSIDKQQIPIIGHQIDLNILNYQETNYSLSFEMENKPTGLGVFLEDSYLNTITELTTSFVYDFTVDASIPESIADDRFSLVFDNTTLSVEENTFGENFSLYPNPANNGQFAIKTPNLSGEVIVEMTNTLGQQVYKETLAVESNEVNVNAVRLSTGVYIVKLTQDEQTFTSKLIVN